MRRNLVDSGGVNDKVGAMLLDFTGLGAAIEQTRSGGCRGRDLADAGIRMTLAELRR